MAFTSTKTFTNVLTIGEDLATQSDELQLVANKMNEIEIESEDEMREAGVKFKKTNEENDLELIKSQWQEIMVKIIDSEKVSEIIKSLNGEISEESTDEYKMKIR